MRRIGTCLLTVAAFSAFGFMESVARARGGEPASTEAEAVRAVEEAGGWVCPKSLISSLGCVVIFEGDKAADDDLAHLKSFEGMQVLVLDGTKITDLGLNQLEGSKKLKVLSLEYTQITDAGLAHLQTLKKLRELDLRGTHITDEGLDALKTIKTLRKITLAGTNVSAEGIKALRRSLPWCRVR